MIKYMYLQLNYIGHSYVHVSMSAVFSAAHRPCRSATSLTPPLSIYVLGGLPPDGRSVVRSRISCLFLIHPIYRKHSSTDHLSLSIKGLFPLTSRPVAALLSP